LDLFVWLFYNFHRTAAIPYILDNYRYKSLQRLVQSLAWEL